jgi:hypothetical protein
MSEQCTNSGPAHDSVNHPAHYTRGGIETIDFIEAKGLGFHVGNALKYLSRAGHKGDELEDLRKARWYIERRIANLERERWASHPIVTLTPIASSPWPWSSGRRPSKINVESLEPSGALP